MNWNCLLKIVGGFIFLIGIAGCTNAALYASYTGSQQGVTIRDVNTLHQYAYFNTGINVGGLGVAANHNIYLASGNHLRRYDLSGALLVDMAFPDPAINYTDVAVSGNKIYASYTGSQQGFTTRDANTLAQSEFCATGVNASSIAVDSSNNIYLSAGNSLLKYDASCHLLVKMTFPDPAINYTGVAVSGNTLYASYTGSQLGFTTRNTGTLAQSAWCTTGINAKSIAVDSGNNIYLAAGNHLHKYSAGCASLADMAFPIATINYTGVYVK